MPVDPTYLYQALLETGRFWEYERVFPEPMFRRVEGGIDELIDDGSEGTIQQKPWFGIFRDPAESMGRLVEYIVSLGEPSRGFAKHIQSVFSISEGCGCEHSHDQLSLSRRSTICIKASNLSSLANDPDATQHLINWVGVIEEGSICQSCQNPLQPPLSAQFARMPRDLIVLVDWGGTRLT
jgi:hypothetical protein